MASYISCSESAVRDRIVLMRVDHNVPLTPDGGILDDQRITRSVRQIVSVARRARLLVLLTHLGYPRGRVVQQLTTKPLARRLAEVSGLSVQSVQSAHPDVLSDSMATCTDRVLYAENVRFLPGEEACDMELAKAWAALADVYVNDAFSVCHRTHASVAEVPRHVFSLGGASLSSERYAINEAVSAPGRRVLICGGAKYLDKLRWAACMAPDLGAVALGGICAIAVAISTGALRAGAPSTIDPQVMRHIEQLVMRGVEILIPEDWVVARDDATYEVLPGDRITDPASIVDVGPVSTGRIGELISSATCALWSGPLGRYEIQAGRSATRELIEHLASLVARGGRCVYGGGDTLAAKAVCRGDAVCGFASCGGGAFLAFAAMKDSLPALASLEGRVLQL